MHSFDEKTLVNELEELSDRTRVAFAAAAATRQLSSYERLALKLGTPRDQRPREIAAELWEALQSETVEPSLWSARLDEVMGLLPEESEEWVIVHALADDAMSSLAYALRCLITPIPQEAAWAGRRAYEAADQAAIRILGLQLGLPGAETAIITHHIVQRELKRQRDDLSRLRAESIVEVKRQAYSDELLTEYEASLV